MKATELRIGNYYLAFGVDLKQVETLTKDKILIDFTPIPLTEEWLLKLGFYKYKGNNSDCFLNGFETACNMTMLFWKGNQIKNIKYVHQLQNLYFALTGEELTIKD